MTKYYQRSRLLLLCLYVSTVQSFVVPRPLLLSAPKPLVLINKSTALGSTTEQQQDAVTTTEEEEALMLESPDVVCAHGICVVADEDLAPELCHLEMDSSGDFTGQLECVPNPQAAERNVLSWEFLWPRALLLGCSVLYGTNFPLGRIMNDALPASATTSGRMLLAAAALSPFLLKLKPELRVPAITGGSFCALGYLSQSVALLDVPAATVAFLGALVVIITPVVNVLLDNAKLGFKEAPQTWIAAALCLVGVGSLELGGTQGLGDLGWGDFWAVMQAVGFGTAFFFTEGIMAKNPDQALPVTAVQVGMTAFFAAIWATLDGTGLLGSLGGDNGAWLLDETTRATYAIPGLFLSGLDPTKEGLQTVALAAAWTGLITTSGNRVCETTALGKMSSSEASVLLATEPLWAALFASVWVGETLGANDFLGGALIVLACLATAVQPEQMRAWIGMEETKESGTEIETAVSPVCLPEGVEASPRPAADTSTEPELVVTSDSFQ